MIQHSKTLAMSGKIQDGTKTVLHRFLKKIEPLEFVEAQLEDSVDGVASRMVSSDKKKSSQNLQTCDSERQSSTAPANDDEETDASCRVGLPVDCTCSVCGHHFDRESRLMRHLRAHIGGGDKHYACEQCEASFSLRRNLLRHSVIHTGARRWSCDECDRTFIESGHLKRHKLTHEGVRPFVCDDCEKSFTQKGSLKRHKISHSGVRPYACDQCEKTFIQSGHLNVHKLVHTGYRPFSCDQCDKSFSKMENLKRHKLSHTGVQPYSCDRCSKKFSHSGSVKRHKLVVCSLDGPRYKQGS